MTVPWWRHVEVQSYPKQHPWHTPSLEQRCSETDVLVFVFESLLYSISHIIPFNTSSSIPFAVSSIPFAVSSIPHSIHHIIRHSIPPSIIHLGIPFPHGCFIQSIRSIVDPSSLMSVVEGVAPSKPGHRAKAWLSFHSKNISSNRSNRGKLLQKELR